MASTGQAFSHTPQSVQSFSSRITLSLSSRAPTGQTDTQPPQWRHLLVSIFQFKAYSSGFYTLCFIITPLINQQVSQTTPSVTQPMSSQIPLSAELRALIEARLDQTLKGIEDTLQKIMEKQNLDPQALQQELTSLEETFNLLFQKWTLEILYSLFLKNTIGFGEFKRVLGVNSRTLSDKLKLLAKCGYIKREVEEGPPLRVEYSLTPKGKNIVLLALPLLYYSSAP
jgi:DNA-binding HxlR family transcriptional regulator